MIEQERLARRIRLCKAMMLWEPDGDTIQAMPDFDTDAEALLLLMEWFLRDPAVDEMILRHHYPTNFRVESIAHNEERGLYGFGNPLSEAILQVIDAAIQSREKAKP